MSAAKDLFTKVLIRAADATKSQSGLFGLLSDNSITLKNLLFSAVVAGLELLLSSKVFDCPLKNHVFYGVMFLVAPVLIVLIMNVLLVGKVWTLTDRCCTQYNRGGECCYRVCPNVAKAFVGPCVWLIASFADTTFYVCAAVGQDIEKRNLTNVTEIKELEAEFADAKAISHILAWFAFFAMVFGTATVMTTKKCCLKDNVLLEDDYILERREAIAALVTFRHFIEHPCEHGDVEQGNGNDSGAPPPGRPEPNASAASTGVSNLSHVPSVSSEAAVVSAPGPSAEAIVSSAVTSASGDSGDVAKLVPTAITRESDSDVGKDEEKDEKKDGIPGHFIGKEEKITLYPEGIPEQLGKQNVEKLFQGWSKDDSSWHYSVACDKFKKM